MSRSLHCLAVLLLGVAACHGDDATTATTSTAVTAEPIAAAPPATPHERLAMRLAVALADPTVRASLKRRLDASHAPEGRLQFQALARADQGMLLASLASKGATSVADLVSDLAAARPLELYLPVEAHRKGWSGDPSLLVATIARDGEMPVAYDLGGNRRLLDPDRPPAIPVLALVPQETDFTGGRPQLAASCLRRLLSGRRRQRFRHERGRRPLPDHLALRELLRELAQGKAGVRVPRLRAGSRQRGGAAGLHRGEGGRAFYWDQNGSDWQGSAMLFSENDRQRYEAAHPGAPIRIVAYEDDDEACVPRVDGTRVSQLLAAVDVAYRSVTSGKVEPWLIRGVRAAPSLFNLFSAVRNIITTGDDLIGNAVETSVAGWAPGGANWLLKSDGTRTYGWFTTEYRR